MIVFSIIIKLINSAEFNLFTRKVLLLRLTTTLPNKRKDWKLIKYRDKKLSYLFQITKIYPIVN
jgi:hypothetical protein